MNKKTGDFIAIVGAIITSIWIIRSFYSLFDYCAEYGYDWITFRTIISYVTRYGLFISIAIILFKRKVNKALAIFSVLFAAYSLYSFVNFYIFTELETLNGWLLFYDILYLIAYGGLAFISVYSCFSSVKEKFKSINRIWFLPGLLIFFAHIIYDTINEFWTWRYLNAANYIFDTLFFLSVLIVCYWLKSEFIDVVTNEYEIFKPEMLINGNATEGETDEIALEDINNETESQSIVLEV